MSVVDFSLDGKIAIVTGGSKGIGRAIATGFAEHGADIVIAARGIDALQDAEEAIAETGRRALGIQADISNIADRETLVQRAVDEFGGVDILVNNVAVLPWGPLADAEEAQFLDAMKTNVWAPLHLATLCRASMCTRGGGVIINITSNQGIRPDAGIGTYALTKAALSNMAQLLGKEWARDGIRVSCIAPGLIRTDLTTARVAQIEVDGLPLNPLQRVGEPGEIAGLAVFLASPSGAYATGMTYVVDGGEVSSGPADIAVVTADPHK